MRPRSRGFASPESRRRHPSQPAPADVVLINVTVEGRYFGIREFLRLLRAGADLKVDKVEASGRLFGVDSIQFAKGGTESSAVNGDPAVDGLCVQARRLRAGHCRTRRRRSHRHDQSQRLRRP